MSPRRRFAALAAAVALAGAVTGCGSDKTLPSDIPSADAPGLIANLNLVLAKCETDPRAAASAASDYQSAVNALPDSVDPDVKKVLTDTANNLETLANDRTGCASGATGTSGLQGFQPETSTEADTTPAPVTSTTTTSATTTTDTTETQTQPAPPGGSEEGAPNGQGPSGEGPPGQQGEPGSGSGGGVGIGGGGD